MARRFYIELAGEDGTFTLHPMKQWLRDHPQPALNEQHPGDLNSVQIRNILKRAGWTVTKTDDSVLIRPPGTKAAPDLSDEEEPDVDGSEDLGTSFALEQALQDFIATNLENILVCGKRLRVYIDATEREGIEFPTEVGEIDILAVDSDGNFYVFELKRARAPDKAIGQLARYMGWVKRTVGRQKDVYGVIVAKSISDKLRYAVSVFPNVSLFEYEIQFTLRPANEVSGWSDKA